MLKEPPEPLTEPRRPPLPPTGMASGREERGGGRHTEEMRTKEKGGKGREGAGKENVNVAGHIMELSIMGREKKKEQK